MQPNPKYTVKYEFSTSLPRNGVLTQRLLIVRWSVGMNTNSIAPYDLWYSYITQTCVDTVGGWESHLRQMDRTNVLNPKGEVHRPKTYTHALPILTTYYPLWIFLTA